MHLGTTDIPRDHVTARPAKGERRAIKAAAKKAERIAGSFIAVAFELVSVPSDDLRRGAYVGGVPSLIVFRIILRSSAVS